jgi:hypothetical protein
MKNKIELYLLENLFEIAYNFMDMSGGDGCSLIRCYWSDENQIISYFEERLKKEPISFTKINNTDYVSFSRYQECIMIMDGKIYDEKYSNCNFYEDINIKL